MAHFARVTSETLENDYMNTPGAGAAGGLGYAFLAYTGAALTPGIELILDAVGLEEELSGADVVVTGEGRLDFQTAMGKAPVGVARLAKNIMQRLSHLQEASQRSDCLQQRRDRCIFPYLTRCLHTCRSYGSCRCAQ